MMRSSGERLSCILVRRQTPIIINHFIPFMRNHRYQTICVGDSSKECKL